MRAEALQTVELLSLEDMHGRYSMKLGVGRDSGTIGAAPEELEAELDELTFRHLQKLDPLSGERVRLSLYAQYDPFRQTHFSSIVKLNKAGSRSYYFDCSAEFGDMLSGLRRGEMTAANRLDSLNVAKPLSVLPAEPFIVAPAGTAIGAGGTLAVARTVSLVAEAKTAIRIRLSRYTLSGLRLLLLSCIFLLVWFEAEGQLHIDGAKALSENQVVVAEGAGEIAKQGSALAQPAVLTAGDADRFPAGHSTVSIAGNEATTDGKGELALAADPSAADSATDRSGAGAVTASSDTGSNAGESKTLAAGFDDNLVELITLDGDAPLYSLPDGYVALTFDDGPSDYTKAIVDLLRERGVAGTFLFVGRHAEKYPKEASYAAEQGMAVGNHSWDHSRLTKLPIDAISADIEKANRAIAKRSASPVSVFRPPYGATNDDVEIATEELGMGTLMWNRDPEDWKAATSADIVRYFKQLSPSGGIYVMHEKKATLDALPDIIDYLLEQGLKFAVFQ